MKIISTMRPRQHLSYTMKLLDRLLKSQSKDLMAQFLHMVKRHLVSIQRQLHSFTPHLIRILMVRPILMLPFFQAKHTLCSVTEKVLVSFD